uniref:RpoA-like protein n=1 Tax=Pelargonium endlicherianum TaxID=158596 RepID=A0A1Y0K5N5_9ROSI|nr:RpoA-like protein [Pelargonium endlicherianum]
MPNDKYFGCDKSNPNNVAEWQQVEADELDNGLSYSRFCFSPLNIEECQLIKIALPKALLTEILCLRFTHAKIQNACKNLMNIVGIQESLDEILQNLGKIILRGNLEELVGKGPFVAILDVRGPLNAMAVDIELPPGIQVVTETQHIATITEPIQFFVELRIEVVSSNSKGETGITDEEGYSIDATPPIKKVDTSIQCYDYEGEPFQTLLIDVWTDRTIHPHEALAQASRKIFGLLSLVFQAESVESKELENGLRYGKFCLYPMTEEQFQWIQTALKQALDMSGESKYEGPVTDEEGDSIDPTFTPVQKWHSTMNSYKYSGETFQGLFIEIFTESKIHPHEALAQASAKIMSLFLIFFKTEKPNRKCLETWRQMAREKKEQHQPGPPGWEEGFSLGSMTHRERLRHDIVSLCDEILVFVKGIEAEYRVYQLLWDSTLQELKGSLDKLDNIKQLHEASIESHAYINGYKSQILKNKKAIYVLEFWLNVLESLKTPEDNGPKRAR